MNEKFNYTNKSQYKKANIIIYISSAILIIGILGYVLKAMFAVQAKKNPFVQNQINKDLTPNSEVCTHIRTIAIDPGHGGKDGGTKGQYSLEKENTLAIALKLGEIIKKNHPYIKIIYTRTTDVFVPLQDRADIANVNEADLFISIHCNSDGLHAVNRTRKARRKAYLSKHIAYSTKTNGTETYILNNDYLLQDNILYTQPQYALSLQSNTPILNNLMINYNPEEDYLEPATLFSMLTGLGKKYNYMPQESEFDRLKKSYQIAQLIEAEFANIGRKSRGVHESHFVVLKETIMPAILIETGFITNLQEEAYLHSDQGRKETAHSIYKAISKYMEFVKSSI